jgi:DNA polymerase-4
MNNDFNPAEPTVMHIDLNSCFASIEQQANPSLRGKPVVVAAYATSGGCVLTSSREAKTLGIRTGMSVGEAKRICPSVAVLTPDPVKYRFVNRAFATIVRSYTDDMEIKSIDEIVADFKNSSKIQGEDIESQMLDLAKEIKTRIKNEIGEWLTVSIGISTNRYLAKIASGIHKPDGLDIITKENIRSILSSFTLEQLCGIKKGNAGRLRYAGISSPIQFYDASAPALKQAFHSITGCDWWRRLHGWESDDKKIDRKSFGQSYALYKQYPPSDVRVHQILCQLVGKMSRRMRRKGFAAKGIHVACLFTDYSFWHKGMKLEKTLYAANDLYGVCYDVLKSAPDKPVRILSVSCHYLEELGAEQEELFTDTGKKRALVKAIDEVWDTWGDFSLTPARMMNMEHKILDRIAFGGVE